MSSGVGSTRAVINLMGFWGCLEVEKRSEREIFMGECQRGSKLHAVRGSPLPPYFLGLTYEVRSSFAGG